MRSKPLFLAVDGGGTRCRAMLCASTGAKLSEAVAGPANIRLGLDVSFGAVLQAAQECLRQAGLTSLDLPRIRACLALAGASEPEDLAAAQRVKLPFGHATITTDARAACLGAHRGHDGGVIIAGTGTIGWAEFKGRHYRVGGWGLSVSDEGSGAWLGRELLRRVLWAYDRRIESSSLLRLAFAQFKDDPHAIVRWAAKASPRDFAALAPLIVRQAQSGDIIGSELMRAAASHIDALAARLVELGAGRLALVGGLAHPMEAWVSRETAQHLHPPAGSALDGALQIARATAQSVAA